MEFEQLVKRLDWLEKEYRKSKEMIASLEEQVVNLNKGADTAAKQIKEINKDVREVSGAMPRIDQFETLIAKQRTELTKFAEDIEKRALQRERDSAKQQQLQIEEIHKSIADFKKTSNLTEIKKKLKDSEAETQRFINNMAVLKERVDKSFEASNDVVQGLKLAETVRKNDLKAMTDIQGDVAALRKRVDENRDKNVLINDSFKNLENRLNELLSSELERKQAHNSFIEQQIIAQRDRERIFKEWDEKYGEFRKETENLQSRIVELDETLRAAKKAQDTYTELNTKLERRINEVTEMQRLAEDRLRQEWISFKADDQKRWTGYTLASEETGREVRKDIAKLDERITSMSDSSQLMQDQLHQTTDITEKKLEDIITSFHEWKESTERIMGHVKAKKPKR